MVTQERISILGRLSALTEHTAYALNLMGDGLVAMLGRDDEQAGYFKQFDLLLTKLHDARDCAEGMGNAIHAERCEIIRELQQLEEASR